MDNNITNEIRKLISEIVSNEIKKKSLNMEYVYDGIIERADNELVVDIKGVKHPISKMKNLSGDTLSSGKIARIYAKGGNLSNAYIGVLWDKKQTEVADG